MSVSERHEAKRIFEGNALFLARGERGRLAVLANEGGVVVPWRREGGAWEKLALPAEHACRVGQSALGLYFGRDDRPRLMGYRYDGPTSQMVYLRFRDGRWSDQSREVGSLAGKASELFGELGEADPEVVCRSGHLCILKRRTGWTVLKAEPPKDALVRAFSGEGYAVYGGALHRGEAKAFRRVGQPGSWREAPVGFWVGADGAAVVADTTSLHSLDSATGQWSREPGPATGLADVVGPPSDRFVAAVDGLYHQGPEGARRVAGVTGPLVRVLVVDGVAYAAGAAGVFEVRAK
jgi:hypothetical protein